MFLHLQTSNNEISIYKSTVINSEHFNCPLHNCSGNICVNDMSDDLWPVYSLKLFNRHGSLW